MLERAFQKKGRTRMNKDDLESVLINENALGIHEMTESFEKSYQHSIIHNKTDCNDLDYLRRYIWIMLALQQRQINTLIEGNLND